MKKILTASLVAIMAVTAANADIASTQYVNKKLTGDAENGTLAFTGVAADQTTLQGAVNAIATSLETNLGEGGAVEDQIENAVGDLGSSAGGQAYTTVAEAIAGEVNELATGAVKDNADAISAITNSTTGIQAVANKYTDDQIDLLVSTDTGEGTVVKSVSQADGKVSVNYGKIANADVADGAEIAQSKIAGLDITLAEKQVKSDIVVEANALTAENLASDVKYPSMAAAQMIAENAVSDLTQRNTALQGAVGAADTAAFKATMSNTSNLTQAGNAADAAKMLDAVVGDVSAENMGTTADTVVGAIMEVVEEKADKSTTLAGYGITDAYTKTETETAITTKVETLDAEAEVAGTNDGSYVTAVAQTDGKIKVSTVAFDTALNGDSTNAVQNKVVNTAIDNIKTNLGGLNGKNIADVPSSCAAGGNGTCSLVMKNGVATWEVVEY